MNKGRRAGRGELSGGPERGTKALVLTRPINRMNLVSEGVDKKRNPGLFHDKKKNAEEWGSRNSDPPPLPAHQPGL